MEGRNQKYIRKRNKEKILNLLTQKEMTYSELARELNISNTAIANICRELIDDKILERTNNTLGRGGIKLKISKRMGFIVAIDFSPLNPLVRFTDFYANLIDEERIEFEYKISDKTFNRIYEIIDEHIIKFKKDNLDLKCISIATPGKIDSKTGYFSQAPRYHNYKDINLYKMFNDRFKVDVVVKNDINLEMLGYKIYNNEGKTIKNACMIHCGIGLGAGILIDGKVYEGSHGFSGEIGLMLTNLQFSNNNNLQLFYEEDNYTDSILSVLSLRRTIVKGVNYLKETSLKLNEDGKVDIADIVESYKKKDKFTVEVVNSHATILARFVKNIVYFMDLDTVIISGEIVDFGEDYFKAFNKALNINNSTRVLFSLSGNEYTILGAVYTGCSTALKSETKSII